MDFSLLWTIEDCCCFLAAQIKKRIRGWVVPPRFKKKRFDTVNDVGVAPADFCLFVCSCFCFLLFCCCFCFTIIYYDIDTQSANFGG